MEYCFCIQKVNYTTTYNTEKNIYLIKVYISQNNKMKLKNKTKVKEI